MAKGRSGTILEIRHWKADVYRRSYTAKNRKDRLRTVLILAGQKFVSSVDEEGYCI